MKSRKVCENLRHLIEFNEEELEDFLDNHRDVKYVRHRIEFRDGDQTVGVLEDFMQPLLYQLNTLRNSLLEKERYERTELDQNSGELEIIEYKEDLVKIRFNSAYTDESSMYFEVNQVIEEIDSIPREFLEWGENMDLPEETLSNIRHVIELINQRSGHQQS